MTSIEISSVEISSVEISSAAAMTEVVTATEVVTETTNAHSKTHTVSLNLLTTVLIKNLGNIELPVNLSPVEIKFLQALINSNPEMFETIATSVGNIVKNEQISLHDIPHIIIALSNIYKSHFPTKITGVDLINVVQYTIDCILDSGLIPLPDIEQHIIKSVVDASINLLRMHIGAIEEDIACCMSFFRRKC